MNQGKKGRERVMGWGGGAGGGGGTKEDPHKMRVCLWEPCQVRPQAIHQLG